VIQIVGYLGSAGAAVMWLPQTIRAVRHRRHAALLAGISPGAYIGAIVFNALLLTYGLVSSAGPVVVAGAVNLACAAVIVSVLLAARRSSA
jgi:hypothetical protein